MFSSHRLISCPLDDVFYKRAFTHFIPPLHAFYKRIFTLFVVRLVSLVFVSFLRCSNYLVTFQTKSKSDANSVSRNIILKLPPCSTHPSNRTNICADPLSNTILTIHYLLKICPTTKSQHYNESILGSSRERYPRCFFGRIDSSTSLIVETSTDRLIVLRRHRCPRNRPHLRLLYLFSSLRQLLRVPPTPDNIPSFI